MAFEAMPNTNMSSPSGAGIGAAQAVAKKGVDAVISGSFGPNASMVLSQEGIKMITGAQGTVRQAVEAFKSGSLKPEPTGDYGQGSFYGGRGAGRGMGMGRGMGRGMGLGQGMGMYPYQAPPQTPVQPSPSSMNREQEIESLNLQLQQLESQLREMKKRLEELKR